MTSKTYAIIAKAGATKERKEVNSSQPYEVSYVTQKLGVSHQALTGAKRATGSNDREVLEGYLKDKKKK